jgi:hypothetical protein
MTKQNKLNIRFDDPENGWIGIEIDFGDNRLEQNLSYAGYNGFSELVLAIMNLWSGPCPKLLATWLVEPIEYDFVFERSQNQVNFEVIEYPNHRRKIGLGEIVFQWSGNYKEICLSFWRALRSLEGRFSTDELTRRYHSEWPATDMIHLTNMIKNGQQS